jgi:hypothetical protein
MVAPDPHAVPETTTTVDKPARRRGPLVGGVVIVVVLAVTAGALTYRWMTGTSSCRGPAMIMGVADYDAGAPRASSKEEALDRFLRVLPTPVDGYEFGEPPEPLPDTTQVAVDEVAWAVRQGDGRLRMVPVERTGTGWQASRLLSC